MKLSSLTPIIFSIIPVYFLYVHNVHLISPDQVILSSITMIIFSVGLLFGVNLIFKNLKKSAILVTIYVILFFTYCHIYNIIDDVSLLNYDIGKHRYLLIAYFAIFAISTISIFKKLNNPDNLLKIFMGVGLASILIISVNYAEYNLNLSSSYNDENSEMDFKTFDDNSLNIYPDIYVVILDEYSDTEKLDNYFDFDNIEFLSFLENEGFSIPEKTFSNYSLTFLLLGSMLNFEYVNYLTEQVGEENSDRHHTYKNIHDNKIMNYLNSKGYVTINLDSGWEVTRNIKSANLNLCGNNEFLNSEFTPLFFKTTLLQPIVIKLYTTDNFERLMCVFNELSNVHTSFDKPVFVFAHILMPHAPYYFNSNGDYNESANEEKPSLDEEKILYVEQVKFINTVMKNFITNVKTTSELQPIIIIQSDTGSNVGIDWSNISEDEMIDRLDIINYYHIPYEINEKLDNEMSPVNSFPFILNNLFGEDIEYLDDRYFFSSYEKPYKFTELKIDP